MCWAMHANGCVVLALALSIAGCGSSQKTGSSASPSSGGQSAGSVAPAEKTPDPAVEAKGRAATGVVTDEYYVVDGEEFFARNFATRLKASNLWNKYFEQRAADRTAKKPFLRFGIFSERRGEAVSGAISATIEINLTITDLASEKRIWVDEALEGMAHHSQNAELQYEELMKRIPKSEALGELVERAACILLCLQGKATLPAALEAFKQHPAFLTPALLSSLLKQNPNQDVALAVLLAGLRSPVTSMYSAALDQVLKMQLDSATVAPILGELLLSPDGKLRIRAIDNLSKIGAPAARQLVDALADDSIFVRTKAQETLLGLGGGCPEVKEQIQHLIELAGNAQGARRQLVLRVLSELGREEGQKTFANALRSDDSSTQLLAAQWLLPLGLKNKAILPELKDALAGPSRNLRSSVLKLLKAIGPEAGETITVGLHDQEAKVRLEAALILEDMGGPCAELLVPFANSDDKTVAGVAKRVLAKYPAADKRAQPEPKKEQPKEEQPKKEVESTKPAGKPKEPPKRVTLKDGTKITAEKVVDFGEAYSVKTVKGKFQTIQKADVEKIEVLDQE